MTEEFQTIELDPLKLIPANCDENGNLNIPCYLEAKNLLPQNASELSIVQASFALKIWRNRNVTRSKSAFLLSNLLLKYPKKNDF